MINKRFLGVLILILAFFLVACGGSTPDPQPPLEAGYEYDYEYACIDYYDYIDNEDYADEPYAEEELVEDVACEEEIVAGETALDEPLVVEAPVEEQPVDSFSPPAPSPSFIITTGGQLTSILGMDALESIGFVDFSAYPRGVQRNFRGVAVADILAFLGIDPSSGMIVFESIDGFGTGIMVAEALDNTQAFIAVAEDGQPFADRGELWADAPFMLVMAQDAFPNRFARYIVEIALP